MWEIKLSALNETTKTNIQTFFDKVRGKARPFYLIDVDGLVYFVQLDSDYNPLNTRMYGVNDTPVLKFRSQMTA